MRFTAPLGGRIDVQEIEQRGPMVATASTRTLRRGTFSRGTVHCPKCSGVIHVFKVTDVTDEFSLTCRACGRRSFYSRRDMSVEQFFDRRAKPRAA